MQSAMSATLGTTAGGDMLAGWQGAQDHGVQLLLIDRPQVITLKRLDYYMHQLQLVDSRNAAASRVMRRQMQDQMNRQQQQQQQQGGGIGTSGGGGGFPTDMDITSIEGRGRPSPEEERALAEVEASIARMNEEEDKKYGKDQHLWGLSSSTSDSDNVPTTMEDSPSPQPSSPSPVTGSERRMIEYMRAGGCNDPEYVLAASKRLITNGFSPKVTRLDPEDLLTVRNCGRKIAETFRSKAVQGDAKWLQRVEHEVVAGSRGHTNNNNSKRRGGFHYAMAAQQKVIVEERDIILARRLWEASSSSSSTNPIVAVIGAGHLPGITHLWTQGTVASPSLATQADEYSQLPLGYGYSSSGKIQSWLVGGSMAVMVGMIAVRKPKQAGVISGVAATLWGLDTGAKVFGMKRLAGYTEKVAAASEELTYEGGGGGGGGGGYDGDGGW